MIKHRVPFLLSVGMLLISLAISPSAGAQTPSPQASHDLIVQGLGRGTAPIDGKWQFHTGDDPTWASPALDDSSWERIDPDRSWGVQGHFNYTGFAWYRRTIQFAAVAGANVQLSLFMPQIDDVYEVFWNGKRIGGLGSMPPHPVWFFRPPPPIFPLGPPQSGVLAIRVWKAPPLSFDSGESGGFTSTPLAGSSEAIANRRGAVDYAWLKRHQYDFELDTLYALIFFVSLLTWIADRKQKLLLWMALFASGSLILLIVSGLRLPIPYKYNIGLQQPTFALEDISLWFLLLYLLQLDIRPRIMRWTRILAWLQIIVGTIDGLLGFIDWSAGHTTLLELTDAILTVPITVAAFYPVVLITFAFRNRLGASRWLVALFAVLTQMIAGVRIASQQGERFTHWTLSAAISRPLFIINGLPFQPAVVASTLLFISIVYAVYRYSVDENRRQRAIEQEFRSAQELQRVLVPDELPSLPGLAVTSAYRPAQEVGGDFFQVIAQPNGYALLILGDVSGKGLKAAMTVALMIGAIRTLAELFEDPAEMMTALNRRLAGRLKNGFATCLILRVAADGSCVFANAGHLPPFLNDREIDLPVALPLGLLPSATFDRTLLQLETGDCLTLYTDGLLEARTPSGELYGFDRVKSLIASRPDARQASEAAVCFGQDDDITVLTVTRLATGVEPTTQLLAPTLVPASA